jgi:hypothetical protein
VSVAGTKLLAIATFVTEDYFDVIGVAPARGRLFTAARKWGPIPAFSAPRSGWPIRAQRSSASRRAASGA